MASLDTANALTADRFHRSDDCAQGVTIGPLRDAGTAP
jgi:hypothetical protein